MAMVAERAGVGAGTIYRYFASKDVLIAEIFNELEKKVVEYLLQGYSLDRPLRDRFIYLSTMIIRYFMNNAIHFRFIEQYMNSPYGVSLRRERLLGKARDIDLFRNLLQEGVDRQALKDLPLTLHFALAFGPILSLLRDHILGFMTLDDALIRKAAEACWDGVRRQDAPG
jgi:AcrR family transcriptional regulator